jgi:hypothetical protein
MRVKSEGYDRNSRVIDMLGIFHLLSDELVQYDHRDGGEDIRYVVEDVQHLRRALGRLLKSC